MRNFKEFREEKDIKFGYTFFDMKDVKKFTGLIKGLKGLEILSTDKMKGGQYIIRVQGPKKVVAKANSLAIRTMSEQNLLLNPELNEALGNENPSHRSKPKMDKDGTVHNVPGKKVGTAYNIKPRLDGKTLKFGTVDHQGNIKVMGLKDLIKVLG